MREIRPSGSEGGVALTRHPYPYQDAKRFPRLRGLQVLECVQSSGAFPHGQPFPPDASTAWQSTLR